MTTPAPAAGSALEVAVLAKIKPADVTLPPVARGAAAAPKTGIE